MKPRFPRYYFVILLLFIAIAAVVAVVPSVSADGPTVFINEIHYDNASTDVNEAVEIAGPAGTDLTSWSVVLYNGSPTQLKVYGTINLAGTIPNQQNGFGTLHFPHANIQNGAPDGLALVDAGGALVQFLCYEGTFTPIDGPAAGQECVDIGVSESSSGPGDVSLQLGGIGSTYGNFTWNRPDGSTFGAVNKEQTFAAGDVPPTVASTNPADGANFVAVDANVEITFSEDVTVTDPWFTFSCDSTAVPAAVSGGPDVYVLDPTADLPSSTTCSVNVIGAQVTDLDDTIDPMDADYSFDFTTSAVCGDPATYIHEVQGSGDSTPLYGQDVTVEAVVVGDFVEYDQMRGFFVQEEKADFDRKKNTSEGVFVYDPLADVEVGQVVRVSGEASEYFGLTQIKNVEQILVCGTAKSKDYRTVNLRLPESFDGQLEWYEGMYVNVRKRMTVAQNYFLGRYGQLTLTSQSRMYQPTNQAVPGSRQALKLAERNAESILFLDDGSTGNSNQNPYPVPYLGLPPAMVLRGGDQVTNLIGVLDYGQINSWYDNDYRLHPTKPPVFKNRNKQTDAPKKLGGDLKVATLNVLNFFHTIDNGQDICGPVDNQQRCRGADSEDEREDQLAKLVAALVAMDADIVGLMEIENHPGDVPTAYLVDALNAELGSVVYDYIVTGALGEDVIRQAIIYKKASVTPEGPFAAYEADAFVDPLNTGQERNRAALAQSFKDDKGEIVTVVVNHFKSKNGPYDDDPSVDCDTNTLNPDCDQGDGQGYFNATRTAGAQALVAWLAGDPTLSGDPDFMIIGDLNAYAKEDPIRAILAAGYTNVAGKKDYSYTFDGLVGTLDYILASKSMKKQLKKATIWHINTDEASLFDYNTEYKYDQVNYYSPDQFRASDHDPVIVGLQLK